MDNNDQQISWNSFSPETKTRIEEMRNYERRLGELLEQIRTAALGIDYQTKVHLRQIEKRVVKKLIDTEIEIKKIFKEAVEENKVKQYQGKLFDV